MGYAHLSMNPDSHSASVLPVMLLAAGRGERMRPLTDATPKPLLQVRGKTLLHWRLEALLRDGIDRVIINTAWLGGQISATLGDSFCAACADVGEPARALQLRYSHEGETFGHALETAGGIAYALDQLGPLFWAMAGDVYAPDFCFLLPPAPILEQLRNGQLLAHIWLIPNPENNPGGDFGWDQPSGLALNLAAGDTRPRWTYSTIGIFHRDLFLSPWCALPPGNPDGERLALAPLLRSAMDQSRVSAALYTGAWTDVGTPQRLAALNQPAPSTLPNAL